MYMNAYMTGLCPRWRMVEGGWGGGGVEGKGTEYGVP